MQCPPTTLLCAARVAQAASLGELAQALHVGFDPQRIVFDSPAKTLQEIR
jgi:diaminopimelate decarboxylase